MHTLLSLSVALGLATVVTVLAANEGLNLYLGGLGTTLVGLPACLYGFWCLLHGQTHQGVTWLSVTVGFTALFAFTPLGEACRHWSNMRRAKRACSELLPYLADMKGRLGAYPPSVSFDALPSSYQWLVGPHGPQNPNVELTYESDGDAFQFLIRRPTAREPRLSFPRMLESPLHAVRSTAYSSVRGSWALLRD
jgi:hypothetical protein